MHRQGCCSAHSARSMTAFNNTYASHCISLQHLCRRLQTLTPSSMLPACALRQASTCLSSSSCASP